MKLTTFLDRCGFVGLIPKTVKNWDVSELKGATFDTVDFGRVRNVFGKAFKFDPDTERFFFRIDRQKALVVDTVNRRVLLSNSRDAYQRLLKYTTG